MENAILKYFRNLYSDNADTSEVIWKSFGIFGLFFLSVFFVYVFPIGFDKLFFIFLLVFFWLSKSNYFWFAFFIIINYSPSGFFQESSIEDIRRLTIFTIIPKVTFSVLDLFLIVALIKAIAKGKKLKFRDVLGFKYVLVFLGFLAVVSFFQGLSIKTFINMPLRGLFFYSFLFSFRSLVNTRKNTLKFLYMFFPFVFLELFSQIYLLYAGQHFISFIYPESAQLIYRDKLMHDSIRSLAPGYSIVVLSFVFSLILYDSPERMTSKYYPIVVMIVSSLSIFISATRQSIIMFGLMYFLYVFFVTKSKPNFVVQIAALLVVMFLIFDFMNIYDIGFTLDASINRLTGAVQFQDGSLEAEDTLQYRLTYRLPILWGHIRESFLFGYGFSDDYFTYLDGHIGGIMIGLLQGGIIGLAFYIFFIVRIYKIIISYIRKFGKKISVTTTLKSLLIGITGLVFLNLFINPMFVVNFSAKPQESFILLVLVYQYIYFGKVEYMLKKRLNDSAVGNKKFLKGSIISQKK